MFKKIKEIKDCDAFDSFVWKEPDLRRYNLIYGWNGSGKTTVSRIFRSIERGAVAAELGAAQFQLASDDGTVKNTDITAPSNNVRVFNDDFVRENLKFNESKTKQILIVGSAGLEAESKIKDLDERKREAVVEKKVLDEALNRVKPLDKIRKSASDEVVKQFANTPLGTGEYSGRKYNRTEVDNLLSKNVVTEANAQSFIIEKQEDIDRRREVIKSQRQKVLVFPEAVDDFSKLFSEANELLGAHPAAEVIEDLSRDDERRLWVEKGYDMHRARASESCLFCGKALDGGFLERLARFFTKEMDEVKLRVDRAVGSLDTSPLRGETSRPDAGLLLPDLSIEYLSFREEADRHAVEIRAAIGKMVQALKDKRRNIQAPHSSLQNVEYPLKAVAGFNEAIGKMAETVRRHNEQIDRKIEAAKEIEMHVVAKMLLEKDYFRTKAEHDSLTSKINTLDKEISEIERTIIELKSAVLDAAVAIDRINGILEEFFGKGHIYLEPSTGTDVGYVLKRRGKNARNLSEGEKNAVALAFFLTKLDEGDFNKKEGAVVIDDPADSQDELFLFRAFGLIKRRIAPCGQLILLTHNFPLFNLVRDWLSHENRKCKREGKDPSSEFFHMRCVRSEFRHETVVEPLHDLLMRYKTEYQYLFHQLYKFEKDGTGIDEPLVPNIGRKVLEYFASFKWSCDVAEELGAIVQEKYVDCQDATIEARANGDFIKKFVDEYSHGKDFGRPISAATFEAKDVAANILKLIETADHEHYARLVALCEEDD